MTSLSSSPAASVLKLATVGIIAASLLSIPAMARTKVQKDTTTSASSGYVASVFDKLQGQWEAQTVDNPVTNNNLLTFTLNDDGTLAGSHIDGAQLSGEANARAVMDLLTKHAPFGPFPRDMKGSRLTFKVKLTPGSLQMLSYQIVEQNKPEPVVAYAASAVSQPVSLFYARALPYTPGRVWDKPETHTNTEQAMAAYVDQVQQQIRQNWKLPQDYNFQRTVAMIMIDRNGSLLGTHLTQSSGDKTVDQAALKAITTAGPFPQVPSNAPSLPVMIEYVFEPVHQSE